MATPQEITYRKAGVEYHQERLSEFGGWEADSTDATLGKANFCEIKNFRRPTAGDYEVRTGQITTLLGKPAIPELDPGFDTIGHEVLAKCEYRGDFNGVDTFFDVTLVYDTILKRVSVVLFEPISNWQKKIFVTNLDLTAESWIIQYAFSLAVTVKGTGSFEVMPTDGTLATWIVRSLGKDVCPTPTRVTFVTKTTGDLLVFDNNGADSSRGPGGDVLTQQFKYDVGDPVPRRIPIPIAANYWLNSFQTAFQVNHPRFWVHNTKDVIVTNGTKDSPLHNKTRGWGYRCVAVQEFLDHRGDKYRVRSHASADFWVADNTYGPSQWGPEPKHFGNMTPGWSDIPASWPQDVGSSTAMFPLPSINDLRDLQAQYRSFSRDNASDPYFYLATYLHFGKNGNNPDFNGSAPYYVDVPVSELKHAPLAILDWQYFVLSGLLGNVVEIEIYRTAHSEADETKNVTLDPNFEPQKYGYVGSILPGAVFTDDVIDDAIDFGTTPEQQDGYLRGQFSGSVSRDFDNRLVFGDIITDYKLLTPSQVVQGFTYDVAGQSVSAAHHYTPPDFDVIAVGDPRIKTRFYYAYIDQNGVQSDAVEIQEVTAALGGLTSEMWVSFVLPRGYDATIQQIAIIRASWDGTQYVYTTIATILTSSGVYISKNDETGTAASLTGTSKRSYGTGSIIYSEPNQIYFWPPLNFEIHHLFARVRFLDVLIGPLFVITDQNVRLTYLDGRREELTKHIGAISRFAAQKVDNNIFILTPYGMYFVESSGVVQFPVSVQTVILPYLHEVIPNTLPLANAKRASIGYLGEREELWLHLPSSKDLWIAAGQDPQNALPHRTIIFKFGPGGDPSQFHAMRATIGQTINYEFDLREDFVITDFLKPDPSDPTNLSLVTVVDDISKYRSEPIIFSSKAMGNLFASFRDMSLDANNKNPKNTIVVVNNDAVDTDWAAEASMEKTWNMGAPSVNKSLRELTVRTSGNGQLLLGTGQPNQNRQLTRSKGSLHRGARMFPVTNPRSPLRHIVSGSVIESVATAPVTRIVSNPDKDGSHTTHIRAIDIDVVILNNHP